MKKLLFLLNFLGVMVFCHAQVGINTTSPSSAAVLDLNSNMGSSYGGFLPPRMTVAQRDAMTLTSAEDGMMAYVTFTTGERCLQLYNGSTMMWESIQCFSVPVSTPGIIFTETMGNPTGNPTVSTYETANNFDNDSFTFSSTAPECDLRTANPSNTTGASGSGYIFMGTATSNARNLLITGITAGAYTSPLTLQLLISKSTTASNASELVIEYYNSATSSWVDVSTTLATGSGTTIWYEKVLSTTVPNTITQIRLTKNSTVQFLIDDIKLFKP